MNNIIYHRNLPEEVALSLNTDDEKFLLTTYEEGQSSLEDGALLIIGDGESKLIQIIQGVNKKAPDMGVVVVPQNPDSTHQLQVAIQFSPFINQYVKIIYPPDLGKFKEIIHKEANLTLTRRRFKATKKETSVTTFSLSQQNTQLKSKFFDKFISQAPVGVVLLNERDVVLDVNHYIIKLLGEQIKTASSYFPDIFNEENEKLEKLLSKSTSSDQSTIFSIEGRDRELKYVQLYISPMLTESPLKLVILLDVTRQVWAEQKTQDYLGRLENQNKELEQFAYILSHDLKNPLSTIKLSCEMAEQAAEEKDYFIKMISRSAENLQHMIEGLEEMIDVRKTNKQKASKISFQHVLDNVLNEYRFQIDDCEVDIRTDFKVPSVMYIESYLTSIFHNMISNAIKYRRDGEQQKIMISTEKSDRYTLLKLLDTGIGIDIEKHGKNLFQPFKRFTDQAPGKGIGLSIIKSMIEKNNGKIEVESTVGQGTTFKCFLCPYPEK